MSWRPVLIPLWLALIAPMLCAPRASAASATPVVTFEAKVRPILKAHCFHCHGEDGKSKGDLDVRLTRLLLKGGESGAAIVPGHPADSLLIQKVKGQEMPKGEKKLTPAEIATLEQWVAAGAKTARPEPADPAAAVITEEERSFWAFQPVKRPAPPSTPPQAAQQAPIDAFLLAKIRENGLAGFSPEADRRTLIRRVYFDLTGLPPSPADVAAFVEDAAPHAYERLVDRLLALPQYGERWGRHWLDVAGYAESDLVGDGERPRPFAWKYRDYVIRAFNADKPFDQFVREQLAGDEMVGPPPYQDLDDAAQERLAATGFLRMAPDATEGENTLLARHQAVAETIKIVGTSLLGLTVGCAQCHDHRYDPIPQADYFRLRAVFDPAFDVTAWRKPSQRLISLASAEDRETAACVESLAKGMEADIAAQEKAALERVFERELAKVPDAEREAAKVARNAPPARRTPDQVTLLKKYPTVDARRSLDLYDPPAYKEILKLREEVAHVRASKPPEDFIAACTEVPGKLPVSRLHFRGDPEQPKQEVKPGELSVLALARTSSEIPAKDPKRTTSGRRLAYANLLTDGTHPLLARVMVNRIWMHHFGRGIVATPGDFGTLGERPTHPELLDWLASDFVANGWRVKRLHRAIVTSRAYRQSSRRTPEREAADPDNRLLARMNVLRLEAEEIRDAVLAVSGKLNPQTYGPSVPVGEDRDGQVLVGRQKRNVNREAIGVDSVGDAEFRRSIYIEARRKQPLAILDTFDLPVMTPNCDLRRPSTVAPQSLMFMNDQFVIARAEDLARRVREANPKDVAAQVRLAWALIYGREPSPEESAAGAAFVAEQEQTFRPRVIVPPAALAALAAAKDTPKAAAARAAVEAERARGAALAAMTSFCQAILASNGFLYVD